MNRLRPCLRVRALLRVAILAPFVAGPAAGQSVGEALPEAAAAAELDEFASVPVEQGPLPPAWSLELGVQGGWDDNPRYEDGRSEASFQRGVQGALSHGRAVKHGHLGFRLNASTRAYERRRDQDRRSFGGGLAWLRRLSNRTTLQIQDDLSSSYTREDLALVTDGQLLPDSHVLRNSAGLGLSRLLSDVASLRLRASHELVDLRDERLIDGQQSSLSLAWRRRLDARRSIDVGYDAERSDPADGPGVWRHAALLGLRSRPRPELFLSASAGPVAFRPDDAPSWSVHPRLEASAALRRRSLSTSLSYAHTVNQAYGYGRDRIVDVAALSLSRQWRSTSAGLGYAFSRARQQDPLEPRTTTHGFDTGLRHTFSRNVVASVSYSLRRRLRGEPGDSYTSQVVVLTLSYAKAWN